MVHISGLMIAVIAQGIVVLGGLIHLSYKAGRVLQTVEEHERRLGVLDEIRLK